MNLIISKNRHKVYKDFSSIGYLGECNSRTIYVTQPKVDDADSYILRIAYSDGVVYDLPIVDGKILITASILREVGNVNCQWIASKSNGNSYDLITKSQVFDLKIEKSISDETSSIPPLDLTLSTYDKIKEIRDEINIANDEIKQSKEIVSNLCENANKAEQNISDMYSTIDSLSKSVSDNAEATATAYNNTQEIYEKTHSEFELIKTMSENAENSETLSKEYSDNAKACSEEVKAQSQQIANSISAINNSRIYISPAGYLYSKDKIALNGQTVIGTKAFSNCQEITKVDVPNGVTILESEAFWGCRSLTSLTVAQSVVTLGTNAFSNCTALTSVKLSEGLKTVGMWAFASCTSLRSINLPTTVTTIIMKAFSGCTALESVTIPAGLTTIGGEPFLGCTSLSNVVLGNGFNCNGLDLTGCPLTVDCMAAMFNALANLTGKAAKTLTLGATNLAKLTDAQKQIATNKNWNLA